MIPLPEYVNLIRKDLRLARVHNERLKRVHGLQQKKIDELIEENKRLRRENTDLKRKRDKVEREKEKLREEIEKLTKTNSRYRVALFDHGNFKHPTGNGKRAKGGQPGHANTNNDNKRDYASFPRLRVHTNTCGGCNRELSRVSSIKEKVLLDIEIAPTPLQVVIQSERQWCRTCQKEVRAQHPQSLPFTEYGINTFMVIMYLRCKGKQSVRSIAATVGSLFGLSIGKSGVDTLLRQAKEYLRGQYEALKQAIRDGEIMYTDETGWYVRGNPAWMWIMASPDKKHAGGTIATGITVYVAAESRGKGIFEEMYGNSQAISMHDGYAAYEAITGKNHTAYCWAHVIRFAYEETVKLPFDHNACIIRERLVALYQTIRAHPQWTHAKKEAVMRAAVASILAMKDNNQTVEKLQHRIRTQKTGLIRALMITEDGTNNLAEREFRGLAISRNISYGSDTYSGMEKTAILASIVQTIDRDKTKHFLPTLKTQLHKGIQAKYPQYKHIPAFTP